MLTALSGIFTFIPTGCAYRLPAGDPPSHETVRILVPSPEQYVFSVNTGSTVSYAVPANGRVTMVIPGYRPSCGVYLFDNIKVGGDEDILKVWSISIKHNGKVVRNISLRKLRSFPTDQDGYRILKIND